MPWWKWAVYGWALWSVLTIGGVLVWGVCHTLVSIRHKHMAENDVVAEAERVLADSERE